MTGCGLLIDTSIYGAAVGILAAGSRDPDYIEVTENFADSARQLPEMVERGFKSIGAQLGDISEMVVSRGPGSFTGIRVGLAYALGLRLGLSRGIGGTRFAGISSLSLLAISEAKKRSCSVALFLPSTKTSGYLALSDGLETKLLPVNLSIEPSLESHVSSELRWQNCHQISIGSWDFLSSSAFIKSRGGLEIYDPRLVAERMIIEMALASRQWPGSAWDNAVTDPIYLRKSSVEEKAMLGV